MSKNNQNLIDEFSNTWHDILIQMLKSGISPDYVYACKKTGRIVTESNYHLLSDDELKEWDDAVLESESIQVPALLNIDNVDDEKIGNIPHRKNEAHYKTNKLLTRPEIFISYSWKNADIAELIYHDLKIITGIVLKKDNRDTKYKESMTKFMKSIKNSDYVIILISDSYLKSRNCMFEINNVLKNKNYKNKIFPILLNDIDFFSVENRMEYIKFWETKIENLKNQLKSFGKITGIESILNELKVYEEIRNHIDEFIYVLCDMNLKTYEQIKLDNYKDILENIIRDDTEMCLEGAKIWSLTNNSDQDLALEKFREKYPDHKHPLYISAVIYEDRKDIDKAIYYFKKLITKYPNYDFAYAELGTLIYENFKDIEFFERCYEKAIELNSDEKNFFYNLGWAMFQEHLYDKAISYYKKVLEFDEFDSDTHTNLAVAYQHGQNDYQLAYKHLCKAIDINPFDLLAYVSLARLMWKKYMKYDEAIKIYHKVIEIESDRISPYLDLGELYISYDEFKLAIQWFKKALEIDKDNLHANLALSFLCEDQSEREKYIKKVEKSDSKLSKEEFEKMVVEIHKYHNQTSIKHS